MSELLPRRPLASSAATRLAEQLDPLTARVRGAELEALAARLDPQRPLVGLQAELEQAWQEEQESLERLATLRQRALATAGEAQRDLVLEQLSQLPDSSRRDRAAARRGRLDLDCLVERLQARAEAPGLRLELACRLLPSLAADRGEDPTPLLPLLHRIATQERRRPTRLAAVRTLGALLEHGDDPQGSLLLQQLRDDSSADPWLRRAALGPAAHLPADAAEAWLIPALAAHDGPDDHLLRARAVALACARPELALDPALHALWEDDSELVRFTLADGLAGRVAAGVQGAAAMAGELLARGEDRSRARLAWSLRSCGAGGLDLLAAALAEAVRTGGLLAGVLLDAVAQALMADTPAPAALGAALASLPRPLAPPLGRRVELLDCLLHWQRSPLRGLAAELAHLGEGEQARIQLPADATVEQLARALVPHAVDGFGFHLAPAGPLDRPGLPLTVTRGEVSTPTAWRVLDELRRPAPAKRPAHSHSLGRADRGPVRVPPGGLAEATPTGVAGQRVLSATQDSWAPELPLVEDLLHALRHDELLLVSPRGTTRVRAPRGFRRWRSRWRLRWSFRRYDQLRLAALEEADPGLAAPWRAALEKLGFEVQTPTQGPPPRARAWLDPLSFALGMGGSTLTHLGLVLLLLAGILFGRLAWAGRSLRRARAALPLVLGGWGTRGKSGTERLKAGLMEALGVPFLSKTTGCEAMILHAPPGGRAHELFLYRPYDKATIWEQADVARLAPRLRARVLLWECMALNPAYVELLQGRWMRDDVATLTNAFPDHEDIQGPTGQDVARVIAGFAPPHGRLLTSEQTMLPVLRQVAEDRGTIVQALHPNEATLLPRDLLARFRHREHPANVALVAALAEGLGLPRVEAVGWMAERVIADVGALVVHPPVDTEGRRVTFAQGQSANDPLSFRHSWREAGFTAPCPPEEWRVTVVNNRADRIARSRMFAGLLADEASAHAHLLIGTNLAGLRAYVAEAVQERLARLDLASPRVAERLVAHLHLEEAGPAGAALATRLGAGHLDTGVWTEAVASLPAAEPRWGACQALAREWAARPARQLARSLPPASARYATQLEAWLVRIVARDLARQALLMAGPAQRASLFAALLDASLVDLPAPGASGDQVIAAALAAAPPGAHVRLIGLQNIKGTGLDFAYRWVEWGELHPRLATLRKARGEERRQLLSELATRRYGSVMAVDGAWAALARLPGEDGPLRAAREQLQSRRAELLRRRRQGKGGGRLRGALLHVVERALDPLDAVRRRGQAHRILGELAAGRISHPRAQRELAVLVDRQKGGWLSGDKG